MPDRKVIAMKLEHGISLEPQNSTFYFTHRSCESLRDVSGCQSEFDEIQAQMSKRKDSFNSLHFTRFPSFLLKS